MKTITILFLLIATSSVAQDNQRIFDAINSARTYMALPPLIYSINEQLECDNRAIEISYNFKLDDECDCDYESIAGEYTLDGLIKKLCNSRRYEWYHFAEDAIYATVSVTRSGGIYYCVVRTYVE